MAFVVTTIVAVSEISEVPWKPDYRNLTERAERILRVWEDGRVSRPQALDQEMFEELKLLHIELDLQHEELHRNVTELESSRNRYFHFFDLAPIPYFILTRDGVILSCNLKASELIGTPRKQIDQRTTPISAFLPGSCHQEFFQKLTTLFQSSEPQELETFVLTRDKIKAAHLISLRIATEKSGEMMCLAALHENLVAHAYQRALDATTRWAEEGHRWMQAIIDKAKNMYDTPYSRQPIGKLAENTTREELSAADAVLCGKDSPTSQTVLLYPLNLAEGSERHLILIRQASPA